MEVMHAKVHEFDPMMFHVYALTTRVVICASLLVYIGLVLALLFTLYQLCLLLLLEIMASFRKSLWRFCRRILRGKKKSPTGAQILMVSYVFLLIT